MNALSAVDVFNAESAAPRPPDSLAPTAEHPLEVVHQRFQGSGRIEFETLAVFCSRTPHRHHLYERLRSDEKVARFT